MIKSKVMDRLKALVEEAQEKGGDSAVVEGDEILKGFETLMAEEIAKAIAPLQDQISAKINSITQPVIVENGADRVKGLTAARALRAYALAGGDKKEAAAWAKHKWGESEPALAQLGSGKTLIEGGNSSGGFTVTGDPAGELIELLRTQSVLRSLGPQIIPMASDSKPIPRLSGGSTSSYIGENTADTASDLTFELLVLRVKKLRATVAISNELQDDADGATDQLVIGDITESMATTEDTNFIRGLGTASGPKGLRYWAASANVVASAGADDGSDPTLAEVREDLSAMITLLSDSNVRMQKPAWIMSNRTHTYMKWNLVDGNNNLVFGPELALGKLNGWDVGVTNNIPDNLGGGTRGGSEIYLVDMADVIIGDRKVIDFAISDSASFVDSSSNTISAFDNDLLVIRAIARHDLVVRHPESIAVRTTVAYATS
jgi:HK97 family phage major capsid protein